MGAVASDGRERNEYTRCEDLTGGQECEMEDIEEGVREDMSCSTNGK